MRSRHEVRKTVTVVFCDVVGSTSLGEQLDAEAVRDIQARFFQAMRLAIEGHGGTVEKYIGDAVMAVFGIPRLHEDDALRAVRAAVDMREAVQSLNAELALDRGATIQIRIGVNTGEVVAGDETDAQAFVTGDAVNVAARLEQLASPGEVLVGRATYRLLREAVEAQPIEPVVARGKTESLAAWRLLRVRDVPSAVPRRMDSPIVGRRRQLDSLRSAFDGVVADRGPRLMTVIGAAGVGKSRLTEEFLTGLAAGSAIFRGRCLPYGEGITYFPVVQAIRQAAGLAEFDPPEVVGARIGSLLGSDEQRDRVIEHVRSLLGLGGDASGEEIPWAIRMLFEAVARIRPVVLVLDDIQWGEPTFHRLVEHLAEHADSPILILCMARPELLDVRPNWGSRLANADTLRLKPLVHDEAVTLVENLLGLAGGPPLPTDLVGRIVATTQGNPLFAEQTLAMLLDEGVLERRDERWVVVDEASIIRMPPSIDALLGERLDALMRDERIVLEAASVIGEEFHTGAVRELVPPPLDRGIVAMLASLEGKGLVTADRSSRAAGESFRFEHLLVREAAYRGIPKAVRAELHERLADVIERLAGDAVAEHDEIVGYHLEQAFSYRMQLGPSDAHGDAIRLRASRHLAAAGRRASARGDYGAAAKLLRRAVDLGPRQGAERAWLLYDLGDMLGWTDNAQEEIEAHDEAVRLAVDAGEDALARLAAIRRSSAQMLKDPRSISIDGFRRQLVEGLSYFETIGDERGLAQVWTELTLIEWGPMRYDKAGLAARQAVEHARRSGIRRLISRSLLAGINAMVFGSATPDEILQALDACSADIAQSRMLEAFALRQRGEALALGGAFDEARVLIASALEIVGSLGHTFMASTSSVVLGEVEMLAGDYDAAESAFRRAYEILEGLGDEDHRSTVAATLARALCALDRFDEAEQYAATARELAADDDLASQAPARSAQAKVLASRGLFPDAALLAREAVEMLRPTEAPNTQGAAWMDLARVLRDAGKPAEAIAAAQEGLALYELKGNRPAAADARKLIDQIQTP